MDTLSGSVSSLKIPSLHRKSNEFHHFKNHFPLQSHLISSTTKPKTSKVSNKPTTFAPTHKNLINPPLVNSSSQATTSPLKQSSEPEIFHQKASTGYAVALLDIARCHNVLEPVERDVKRLFKWLRNEQIHGIIANPSLERKEKGEILKEIVKNCKFHKYLLKLVNLLVEKSKVEIVSQVLMEFRRIYDELSGCASTDQVVLVSSEVKMERTQVLGIAKRVQKLSGAVKVTVRQLADERLMPSFAV
ncbi:hypothetical protein DH2020_006241 [Rehmannia glutinosa]|uniref:ATP synthase delta chain n=1 Tax=Rehmannia glutinosa TaxID=99300 RepID=A0ABR0XIB7_REHGL